MLIGISALNRKCRLVSQRLASTVVMYRLVTDVLESIVNTPEVVVSLVVCTTIGMSHLFYAEQRTDDTGVQYQL